MKAQEQIDFHYQVEKFSLDETKIKLWILEIIKEYNNSLEGLQIIFCSDEELLEINKEYLNHDYYTDIITFPYQVNPIIGDIFISVDRVRENAIEYKVSFLNELRRVIIHGVLHLLGFDDLEEESKQRMHEMEDKALEGYN
ncbi:MAG: rRNA maturation RNase YbeY [Saprospiraceae bacterium]